MTASRTLEPADVVVAPSAVHVDHVRQIAKAEIGVAAQNCYVEATGAFTGENRWACWRAVWTCPPPPGGPRSHPRP